MITGRINALSINGFDLIMSSELAAIIIGIARRKENSTAVCLESPMSIPVNIDAAARDTPGMIDTD